MLRKQLNMESVNTEFVLGLSISVCACVCGTLCVHVCGGGGREVGGRKSYREGVMDMDMDR